MIRPKTKRKAVSVVISTLLVLAITIVGALSISNLMSTSALTTINQTPKAIIVANSVLLIGYDTRDGTSLSNIPDFDNKFDDKLCTNSCNISPNDTPSSGGTDFIVLQLWNKNTSDIPIKAIQINGIMHPWDTSTRNVAFDPLAASPPAYPAAGKFSIIPHSNVGSLVQNATQFVHDDQEKRIIVKLNSAVEGKLPSKDIGLGEPLEVIVHIEEENPAEFVILSGETR